VSCGGVNEDNFLDLYAEAYCGAWFRCPEGEVLPPDDLTMDVDDCIEKFTAMNNHLSNDVVPGDCTFDDGRARDCINDMNASCNSEIVVNACDQVWVCP
jgi:hypothetical protein